MPRRLIDLSVALETGIKSDPEFMLPKINYLTTDALNVRDIFKYEKVVILKNALSDIEKRLL